MKYIFTAVLLIVCISVSAQRMTRKERKEQRYAYRVAGLPGVDYKRSIKPRTVALTAVCIFIGFAIAPIIEERIKLRK